VISVSGAKEHALRVAVESEGTCNVSLFDAQFDKQFLYEVAQKMDENFLLAELDGTPTTAVHVRELAYRSAGGVVDFTDLADVPSAYTGHSGESLRVNATETGLEFFVPGGGAILFGIGNPNGTVVGNRGQTYQDTVSRLFYRCDANTSTMWSLV